MDDETALALNRLNVEFYRTHAEAFSARRERPWSGWARLLGSVPDRPLRVLDVGCGNARFGRFLAAHRRLSVYAGVDASEPLLAIARSDPPSAARVEWVAVDFVASPPDRALPRQRYDLIALFGVLHGVPGEAQRRRLLAACADRLDPDGLLVFTCWGFTADPRIAGRIEALAERGPAIDTRAFEPGDHLVPWGDEGGAFRYGRDIGPAERRRLLGGLGLALVREFSEDGPERTLNHYSVLRRALPGEPDRG